jgi:predicted nucleic acid-binding Zn ribbon protein
MVLRSNRIDGGINNGEAVSDNATAVHNEGMITIEDNIITGGTCNWLCYGVVNSESGVAWVVGNSITGGTNTNAEGLSTMGLRNTSGATMYAVNNSITGGVNPNGTTGFGVSTMGTGVFVNNTIDGGSANNAGGNTIGIRNGGDAIAVNNIIDGGSDSISQGVLNDPSGTIRLINNDIWGNEQERLLFYTDATGVVQHVTDLATVNGCAWEGCVQAQNNISTDPELSFAGNGYYNLDSGSACIDAGANPYDWVSGPAASLATLDWEDDPRPQGSGWDIGADED